jgi:hypothetical protein
MNIIEIIAQDVFDKVRSRFTNLEMGDENGAVTSDPKDARFFDFDFAIEGNNLGRVSISINERGTLKVYYGQGILEGSDPITQGLWYKFLREMRFFAKRRMLRFDTRDITKGNLNKDDFQHLAQTGSKENNMNESKLSGTKYRSYRQLESTRLVIKHKKDRPVDESVPGARSRNIEAMFIENAAGERFKYPFIHLAGAKAMQRHVANGGYPHDPAGRAIIQMSENIAKLNSFKRHAAHHDGLNQEAHEIVDRANAKLESLKNECLKLSSQGFYEQWMENFVPIEESGEIDPVTMEDYKTKFTVQQFDETLTDVFPLLHRIMQETGELDLDTIVGEGKKCTVCHEDPCQCDEDEVKKVDEFADFELWADRLAEGYLEPDTIMALKDLLDGGLEMGGKDALGAIQALQDIGINDEELEGLLQAEAKLDPMADPAEAILKWLGKTDPEAAQELTASAQQGEAPQAGGEPAPGLGINEPNVPDDGTPNNVGHGIGTQGGIGESSSDLMSALKAKYDELAPHIEKHKDEHGAMNLFKELQAIAQAQGATKEFKNMLNGAQRNAHMDYDTNPGGFENWFWYLPFAGEEGEETMTNAEPEREKLNTKEIAEVVKSFYDRETGKFPKGETGVVTHCKKMFGDQGGQLAERLVAHLSQKGEAMAQENETMQQFESIKKLAGLVKEQGPKKSDIPAYQRKKSGDSDWRVTHKDLEKDKERTATSPEGLAKRKRERGIEETADILKLAGLAK